METEGLWQGKAQERLLLQPQLEVEMLAQDTVWIPPESLQQQLPERMFHFRFLPDSLGLADSYLILSLSLQPF